MKIVRPEAGGRPKGEDQALSIRQFHNYAKVQFREQHRQYVRPKGDVGSPKDDREIPNPPEGVPLSLREVDNFAALLGYGFLEDETEMWEMSSDIFQEGLSEALYDVKPTISTDVSVINK